MKMNFRRGIALILAIALVITTLSWTAGNTLRASDDEEAYTQETHAVQEAKPEPKQEKKEEPKAEESNKGPQDEVQKSEPVIGDTQTIVLDAPQSAEAEQTNETEKNDKNKPAVKLSKKAGNISVSVDASEGAFPEGVTLKVTCLNDSQALKYAKSVNANAKDAEGVEIKFTGNGSNIEPDKKVSVTMTGLNLEGSNFEIAHVSDHGSVNKVNGNVSKNSASFKADDFSSYIAYSADNEEVSEEVEIETDEEEGEIALASLDALEDEIPANIPNPTFTLSETKFNLTYIGETKTITANVKDAGPDAIVEWSSSNEAVATVDGGVIKAVDEGSATITATLKYYDDRDGEYTLTEDVAVTVKFGKYIIYHYALIPGMSATTVSGNGDSSWFGIGETYVTGLPDPKTLTKGTHPTEYKIGDVAEGKTLFPNLTYGGVTYKYAPPGSENAKTKGYYTLQVYRCTVSNGANAGNNNYNKKVSSGNTYHLDYLCVINERDYYTVNFAVKNPGSGSFGSLTDTSVTTRVEEGTSETTITKPSASLVPAAQKLDGITYELDGWYRDEACTTKCNFDEKITSNTTYYARYNPTNQKYKVQYYYDNVLDSSATITLGPVPIGTEITDYTDKARNGYVLLNASTPLTVSADVSKNVINVYYTKRTVPYTVNYYIENTTTKLTDSIVNSGKYDAEVSAEAKEFEGYTLVGAAKTRSIILGNGTNEINFYYARITHKVSYEWDGQVPEGELLPAEVVKAYGDVYAVDTKYVPGYTSEVHDAYGNVTGVYTFGGWNKSGQLTIGDEDIVIEGSWTYEAKTVAQHKVLYSWTGLPESVNLFNLDGELITPATPETITSLVKGQSYNVDDTYTTNSYALTHDEWGNVNARYDFSGWTDPGNGIMGEEDLTITGEWSYQPVKVTTHSVTYEWTGQVPGGVILPGNIEGIAKNQPYNIDKEYNSQYSVPSYDNFGNMNGTYVFSGWEDPNNGIMGEEDVLVTGTWEFTKTDVPAHNVKYAWTDLPSEALYTESGATTVPSLPSSITDLVKNQGYTVDVSMPGTVVYTHDAYGNENCKYTLGSWEDPNEGLMGDEDVTVTAAWQAESIPVAKHSVTYTWGDNGPVKGTEGVKDENAVSIPTDNNAYVKGQSYLVDNTYSADYAVNTYDQYGNVNGVFKFSGWNPSGEQSMGNADVSVKGSWSYEKTDVQSNNVVYSWEGLPVATLYDADDNVVNPHVPSSITGLVNNQPYTVDTSMPGTIVYTHDAYGNKTASYTLGSWIDSGNGKMGDSDISVTASWSKTSIDVPKFSVTYSYQGEVPKNAPSVPVAQVYSINQNVDVATLPSVPGYTFAGWIINGNKAPSSLKISGDVQLTGSFIPNDTAYTVNYYKQTIAGDYIIAETSSLVGKTDAEVAAVINSYVGFTFNSGKSTISGTVTADGELVLDLYYDRKSYSVTYVYEGKVPETATTLPETKQYKYGEIVEVSDRAEAAGYDFIGWASEDMPVDVPEFTSFKMPAHPVEIFGFFGAHGDTKYTVEHYFVENDGEVRLGETSEFTGETDSEVVALPKRYEDYTYIKGYEGEVLSGTIAGDGSLVLKVYYERNLYNLVIHYVDKQNNSIESDYTQSMISGTMFNVPSPKIKGYTPKFSSVASGKNGMPKHDLELTVVYSKDKVAPTPADPTNPNNNVPGTDDNPGITVTTAGGGITIIPDNQTPAAAAEGTWGLLNLLLTILTCLISIMLLILYFIRKKNDEGTDTGDTKRNLVPRLLSAAWAVLMIITFIITEDMSLSMVLVDNWTILMTIMTIVQVIIAVFAKKNVSKDDESGAPEAVA